MCMNYICMDTDVIYTLDYAFYILLFFPFWQQRGNYALKLDCSFCNMRPQSSSINIILSHLSPKWTLWGDVP